MKRNHLPLVKKEWTDLNSCLPSRLPFSITPISLNTREQSVHTLFSKVPTLFKMITLA